MIHVFLPNISVNIKKFRRNIFCKMNILLRIFHISCSQDILEESPEEPANYPGMEMEMTRINSNKRSFNSASMRKKFTHQLSLMDTQRDSSGSIQITYWF